jgi:hypothetical protein
MTGTMSAKETDCMDAFNRMNEMDGLYGACAD